MLCKPRILSLFLNLFNKFNKTFTLIYCMYLSSQRLKKCRKLYIIVYNWSAFGSWLDTSLREETITLTLLREVTIIIGIILSIIFVRKLLSASYVHMHSKLIIIIKQQTL